MAKLLSAIFIIFNFLYILVNGSVDLELQSQVQFQVTQPQLPTEPGPQPHVEPALHPHHPHPPHKKHHKKPQVEPALHPHHPHPPHPHHPHPPHPHHPHPPHKKPHKKHQKKHNKKKHHKKRHPHPQPQVPIPDPLLPIPTPMQTEPQPQPQVPIPVQPLPFPTPMQTEPQPLPQVPDPVQPLPIPTPMQTEPQPQPQLPNPFQPLQQTLQDMYSAMTTSKPQAYLASHNIFREKMGVPPLQWDTKLEDYAFAYASKCAKDCLVQHSYGPYGENLYWELYEESTPHQIVKSFTDEQVNYDLDKGACKCEHESGKCMCGHFTAIIWRQTERMACAEARCENEKGKLVVCSYDPPGNVIGENPLQRQ